MRSRACPLLCALALTLLTGCDRLGLAALNIGAVSSDYDEITVPYGKDEAQQLDIYIPTDIPVGTLRPVVVFLYGGRWENGSKDSYGFLAARFVREGYVVVVPDYRKYPQVRFPVFVQDAAKAVAWVDDNIDRYGGDPKHVHLAGHSAGAHIGALLVADERYMAAEGKQTRAAIIDFAGLAGPYDFTPDEEDLIDMFGPPARYAQMQAPTFIDGREPPMLLLRGLDDDVVGPENQEHLAAKIRARHGVVEVMQYPGLGHIGVLSTFSRIGPDSRVAEDMLRFFREDDAHE